MRSRRIGTVNGRDGERGIPCLANGFARVAVQRRSSARLRITLVRSPGSTLAAAIMVPESDFASCPTRIRAWILSLPFVHPVPPWYRALPRGAPWSCELSRLPASAEEMNPSVPVTHGPKSALGPAPPWWRTDTIERENSILPARFSVP